jgi:hypothetical protein
MKFIQIFFIVGILAAGSLHAGKDMLDQKTGLGLIFDGIKQLPKDVSNCCCTVASKTKETTIASWKKTVELQATPAGRVACCVVGLALLKIAAYPLKK